MTHATLSMLLIGLSMSPTAPESVAIDTDVQTWRAQAVADDVSGFLVTRVQEAWGLVPTAPDPQFSVRLTWPGPDRVQITVRQGDRQWVDRPLPVDDPSSARAMVWLLVRSTIERALVHAAAPPTAEAAPVDETPAIPRTPAPPAPPRPPAPPAPAAAPEDPSEVEVALVDEDKDAAWLAGSTESATVAAAPPPAPSPEADAPATPSASRTSSAPGGIRRLWTAPFALADGDAVEAAVIMRGFADPSSGFGWGPAAQARLVLSERWVLGGELGYRSEHKGDAFEVDHVPLTLLAGYRFGESLPLELGLSATLDTRFVTARANDGQSVTDTTGVTAGLLFGGYARGFYSLWARGGDEVRVFGELATRFGAVRSAYVIEGEREQDAVVTFSTGVGLEWRWR